MLRSLLSIAGRAQLIVGLLAVAAIVVAGCVAPRAALGTSNSLCFQALPVAADAVAGQGRLAGVARVTGPAVANLPRALEPGVGRARARGSATTGGSPATLAPAAHNAGTSSSRPERTSVPDGLSGAAAVGPGSGAVGAGPGGTATTLLGGRALCLVAFRGTFDPARIPLLRGARRTGRYAIVVVGVRTRRAGAVFLTDQLPPPLTKA